MLTLSGTLPVTFRGTIYRFPVKIWVPEAYPREAPMGYVTPSGDMIIRAGQHVGVDGRIYHPYLRDWGRIWDRASIAEFLEFLQQVFAKEPPVISKAQQQQYQRQGRQSVVQQQPVASPAPPQLPPKQTIGSPEPAEMPASDVPPPRPPKADEQSTERWPNRSSSRNTATDGPPLPPLPHERRSTQLTSEINQSQSPYRAATQPPVLRSPSQSSTYANGRPSGPPLPHRPDQPYAQQQTHHQHRANNYDRSPVSPLSPTNGYSELPEAKYTRPPPIPQPTHLQRPQLQPPQPPPIQRQYPQYSMQLPQPNLEAMPPQPFAQGQAYTPPQHQQVKQPPPDLLSDPFDIALPGSSPSDQRAPAPPIPPNPEKEHLLQALSKSFVQQVQQKVHQNLSAIAPLQAQQHALRAAQERLESEIHQLEQLDQTLASNEAILHRSIRECEQTIKNAKSKPPPPIDEVLIAPTMVANQLWSLCAEEAACREAMYVLQKAVDRGRVSGHDFVRQMRSLGRECFLKMVLARKCARGMGLDVDGR